MDNNEIFGAEKEKYTLLQVISGSILFFVVLGALTLLVLAQEPVNYQLEDTGEVYK